jgi:hypothetical protein
LNKFLLNQYFAALQLFAIHVIFSLQIFCCAAAFLSGRAAIRQLTECSKTANSKISPVAAKYMQMQ